MKKTILGIIIGLTFISSVYALGIATNYGSDYLRLLQGTNYKYSFRVQNMEDSALPVRIELNDPNGIAKFDSKTNEYIIQPKTADNEFFIDINIPENAEIGEKYVIEYKIRTGGGGKGQITFGRGIGKEFTVEVVEKIDEDIESEGNAKVWLKGLFENIVNNFNRLTGNFGKVIGIENSVWLIWLALVLIASIIGLIAWKKSK